MKARRWLLAALLGSGGVLAVGSTGSALAQVAGAALDWRKEFEDICGKTQDAMALPSEALKGLVSRCDKLKPQIETLDESQRKVYSRRLQVCRDLYQFVLDSREKG